MRLMTLEKFLQAHKLNDPHRLRNAWVHCDGFKEMYVRMAYRKIGGVEGTLLFLDLANLEADRPGNGAFKRLVAEYHPKYNLYVENVLTDRFAAGLQRMGFVRTRSDIKGEISVEACFYLLIRK